MTAAVVAAVIFFALLTLPPRAERVNDTAFDSDLTRRTLRGAYHVHTTRSDGAWDKPSIAGAAARAGLKFVIFTDHGDGMRPADPPAYLSNVLCIDGVEISTNGGHYVALDMRPAPYPLGGEANAVVEDVARLGGFGIAAHPDSVKRSLAWTDWEAPIDGIEWLSLDSEWRDESRPALAKAFLHYLFRPAPALASMFDRPATTLERWDTLTRHRRVVALAAHDAHGGIGRGLEDDGSRKRTIGHLPSYEAAFKTFSDVVILDAPPSGDPALDARAVIDAIRRGRVFTVIDAIATPGYADLRAQADVLTANATMPPAAELVVVADGAEARKASSSELVLRLAGAAAARAEVRVDRSPGAPPVPWLLTNPVYFFARDTAAVSTPENRAVQPLPPTLAWHVEKDPRSTASIASVDDAHELRFTLAPTPPSSQFVALVADVKGRLATGPALAFSTFAERPLRVSVQLRYEARGGERWGSSVYVDSPARQIVVPVERMRPLDRQAGPAPDAATASSLLFVVDLTNARPGDSNAFRIAGSSPVRSPGARQ